MSVGHLCILHGLFGLSFYTKDLYLVITQKLTFVLFMTWCDFHEKHVVFSEKHAVFMKSISGFHEKHCGEKHCGFREKHCSFHESIVVFVKSIAVFVKSVAVFERPHARNCNPMFSKIDHLSSMNR